MIKLLRKILGTEEKMRLLRSIDSRLATLEACVRESKRGYGADTYLTTGHWNDK